MPERVRLTEEQVRGRLGEVGGWEFAEGELRREFEFGDFVEAFGFMSSVALAAEKLDHHPNWSNVYNRVRVGLSTHDADGVTDFDFALAARIDQLASSKTSKADQARAYAEGFTFESIYSGGGVEGDKLPKGQRPKQPLQRRYLKQRFGISPTYGQRIIDEIRHEQGVLRIEDSSWLREKFGDQAG